MRRELAHERGRGRDVENLPKKRTMEKTGEGATNFSRYSPCDPGGGFSNLHGKTLMREPGAENGCELKISNAELQQDMRFGRESERSSIDPLLFEKGYGGNPLRFYKWGVGRRSSKKKLEVDKWRSGELAGS